MKKQTFSIPNISCGHCTSAIENELSELQGISRVEAYVKTKTVLIEWDTPATLESILAALEDMGYPAAH